VWRLRWGAVRRAGDTSAAGERDGAGGRSSFKLKVPYGRFGPSETRVAVSYYAHGAVDARRRIAPHSRSHAAVHVACGVPVARWVGLGSVHVACTRGVAHASGEVSSRSSSIIVVGVASLARM
jgi:hypothetical protein